MGDSWFNYRFSKDSKHFSICLFGWGFGVRVTPWLEFNAFTPWGHFSRYSK